METVDLLDIFIKQSSQNYDLVVIAPAVLSGLGVWLESYWHRTAVLSRFMEVSH